MTDKAYFSSTGLLPSLAALSRFIRLNRLFYHNQAIPFSLATTGGITYLPKPLGSSKYLTWDECCFLFLRLLRCFSSPSSLSASDSHHEMILITYFLDLYNLIDPKAHLMVGVWSWTNTSSIFRFPHSEISGSKDVWFLPGAYRPPTASFIGLLCQGIHLMLLKNFTIYISRTTTKILILFYF
jgi:hypothetical protein